MKKNNLSLFMFIVLAAIVLPSCSSIYDDTPSVTFFPSVEVDPNEEYFSLGEAISRENSEAYIYKGSWIFCEQQQYEECVRTTEKGEKIYVKRNIQRWVKYNPYTGETSSICLDPVCTHGPGSKCISIAPDNCLPALLGSIVGDWIIISHQIPIRDTSLGFIPETYAYNLKNGECFQLSKADISGAIISKLSTNVTFGNKYYVTKQVLDYSNTEYVPGNDIEDLNDYVPETITYLCVFDFDTRKFTELFEIKEDYKLCAVTSERFYFKDGDLSSEIYSTDRNGNGMRKEDAWSFSPGYCCGTYGYDFGDEYKIFDLRTDTTKIVPKEFSYQRTFLCDDGILFSTFSGADDSYAKLLDSRQEWKNYSDFVSEVNKRRYESTSQIYLMSFDGSSKKVIFEGNGMILDAYYKSGKYIYGFVSYPDPNNNYKVPRSLNGGRSVINIETGEITSIPLLELILPENCRLISDSES